jgi:hypothetical protein
MLRPCHCKEFSLVCEKKRLDIYLSDTSGAEDPWPEGFFAMESHMKKKVLEERREDQARPKQKENRKSAKNCAIATIFGMPSC